MNCKLKRIVVDDDIPYIKGVLEPYAEVAYIKGVQISHRDLECADALIVRTRTFCGRELLCGTPVKLIATATIGFDHIDMEYCREAGVEVTTAAGCNARAVLQWVAAVLACDSKRYAWCPSQKTLGVVGVGHVGSLVAEYGLLWGFNVVCCDPLRARDENLADFITLEELTAVADIVTFHVPLSLSGRDATIHMADKQFFDRLICGALVLNSSRGEVVDPDAVRRALLSGDCRCAIDTWSGEPKVDAGLVGLAEFATPHIAGYSAQGKAVATAMVVEAVARHFGLPISGWYPSDVPVRAEPVPISWEQMCATMVDYFDLRAQSSEFARDVSRFETMRNGYKYRKEYF